MGVSNSDHTSKSLHNKKIVSEYECLSKELEKQASQKKDLQLSLSTLQLQNKKLIQEVEGVKLNHTLLPASSLRHEGGAGGGKREAELLVRVEELQAEVEKKTTMLMDVKKQLREATERKQTATPTDTQATHDEVILTM